MNFLQQTSSQSKLSQSCRSLSGPAEGMFMLDHIDELSLNSLNQHENKSTLLKVSANTISNNPQDNTPTFLKLYYASICVCEELLETKIHHWQKETDIDITVYIEKSLYKTLGVSYRLPNFAENSLSGSNEWIKGKLIDLNKRSIKPKFIVMKIVFSLITAKNRKEKMLRIVQNLSEIAKELQENSLVPVIEVRFKDDEVEDLKELTVLMRAFLAELIFGFQNKEVYLEAIILSLSITGQRFVKIDKDWQMDYFVERIVFLNYMVWIRTIPAAIPTILINEGEYRGEEDFANHCKILHEMYHLKLPCPWNVHYCAGRMLYQTILEQYEADKDSSIYFASLFNTRVKTLHDCYLGALDPEKFKESDGVGPQDFKILYAEDM